MRRALAFSAKKKTLEQAQKYVQKGAYDKALKEYQKHLKDEPSDTNVRLKVGDLHLKRGDRNAAIEAYTQVAAQFSKSGFDAKAVAIYKQILRIDSNYLAARRELGDHFQRMGLASDALREFQEAVRICQERGLKRDAFDLLKRVATLDPGNVANRLSLSELLIREKLGNEAKEEFVSLLEEVAEKGQWEDAARVATRFAEAFPDDERAVAGLARASVHMGEVAAAAKVLKGALPRFPDSIPLRQALVEACQQAGDKAGESEAFKEIAEIYKRRGDPDKAREILQLHVPMQSFGDGSDETPSLVLSEESDFGLGTPGDVDLGAISEPGMDDIELVAVDEVTDTPGPAQQTTDELLAEARVSLEFDDRENAARLARRVLEVEPNSSVAKKILADATATKKPAPAKPAPAAKKPAPAPAPAKAKPAPPKPAPAARPAAPPAPKPTERAAAEAEDLLYDSLPDIELVLEDEEEAADDFASVEPPTQVDLSAPVPSSPGAADEEEFEIEIEEEDAGKSSSWDEQSAIVTERLEEANALFDRGKYRAAEREYLKVLERAPHHPQALVRLGEIAERLGGDPSKPPVQISDKELGDTHIEEDVEPSQPRPRKAEKARPAKPAPKPEPDAFDPAELVADEDEAEPERLMEARDILDLDEIEGDEEDAGGDDFDLAAALDDEGGQSGTGFDEVFKAFKKGIQEQIGDEEAGAHYDLAIAYKEMGLLDDAVEQLELVRRSDAHRIEGLSLMATCKLELGRPQEAAGHLAEALAAANANDPCVVPLRYDMGEALLAAGKRDEALDAFRKVAAAESDFREVQERLAELDGN